MDIYELSKNWIILLKNFGEHKKTQTTKQN